MPDLPPIDQVMEVAYNLNRQSVDAVNQRFGALAQSRQTAATHSHDEIEGTVQSPAMERAAEMDTERIRGRRMVSLTDTRMGEIVSRDADRLRAIRNIEQDYRRGRLSEMDRGGTSRRNSAWTFASRMNEQGRRLGPVPHGDAHHEGWLERIRGVVETFNRYGDLAGLPHIPENVNQLAQFIKEKYETYQAELREAMQVQAVGGWEIQDTREFMKHLLDLKTQFPSLAAEVARTSEGLARDLPRSTDPQLTNLTRDVRDAAFLLDQTTDQLGKTVGNLSRVTGQSGEEILAAIMTVRDFATRGSETAPADVALDSLIKSFSELTTEGRKYGLSVSETAYLAGRYRHQLQKGVLTVQNLVQFATSLKNQGSDQRLFMAYEIINRLSPQGKLRDIVQLLKSHEGDDYALDRIMEVISSGAVDVARDELGLNETQLHQLQQEQVEAQHQVIHMKAMEFAAGDKLAASYIEDQLNTQFLGMSQSLTPDQKAEFRNFKLEDAKIKAKMEDEDRKKVEAAMEAQENIFRQAEARIGQWLMLLSSEIDQYVHAHPNIFSAVGLGNLLKDAKSKALTIGGTHGGAGATTSPIPTELGSLVTPVDPWLMNITSHLGRWTPTYRNKAGKIIPAHSHMGVDIGVPANTPVYAVADGEVMYVNEDWTRGGGIKIAIRIAGDVWAVYMHLNEVRVKTGDKVSQGQLIALSGGRDIGEKHLHFELRKGGRTGVGAYDPEQVFHGVDKTRPESGGAKAKTGAKKNQQSSYTVDVHIAKNDDRSGITDAMVRGGMNELRSIGAVPQIMGTG